MVSGAHARVYGSAWRKMRTYILARDSYTCQYCAAPATTVDHVESVNKGGEVLNPENLVAACVRCNSSKQDKGAAFFYKPVSTAMLSRVSLSPPNETISYE